MSTKNGSEMNKTALWDAVCETDPKHTKKVTFGRSFTAIDPMYQIKCATKQFGAAGKGWGWEVSQVQFLPNDTVAVLVRLWHGSKEDYVEQWGQCGLYTDNKKEKADQDCVKKATTDGITKCLSYLGFNADVFMGLFDDNKYVAAMNAKYGFTKEQETKLVKQINNSETLDDLEKAKAHASEFKERMTPQQVTLISNEIKKVTSFLGNKQMDNQFEERMAAE